MFDDNYYGVMDCSGLVVYFFHPYMPSLTEYIDDHLKKSSLADTLRYCKSHFVTAYAFTSKHNFFSRCRVKAAMARIHEAGIEMTEEQKRNLLAIYSER